MRVLLVAFATLGGFMAGLVQAVVLSLLLPGAQALLLALLLAPVGAWVVGAGTFALLAPKPTPRRYW